MEPTGDRKGRQTVIKKRVQILKPSRPCFESVLSLVSYVTLASFYLSKLQLLHSLKKKKGERERRQYPLATF